MKLVYFNAHGRIEVSRLILTYVGKDFEDKRVKIVDWPALKPAMPGGQLPVLEMEGLQLGQPIAIARFIANRYNLAGKNPVENAKADMIVDCIHEVLLTIIRQMFEAERKVKRLNDPSKKEIENKIKNEIIPAFLRQMSEILIKNGGEFMVGKGITWADIAIAWILDILITKDGEIEQQFPRLYALMKNFYKLPRIKSWRNSHSRTNMFEQLALFCTKANSSQLQTLVTTNFNTLIN